MAAGIFISYRRDDSRHVAGRLADDLAQAFGSDSIFRDIEGISLGLDFTQSLDTALASCSVMLVLIGPNWLTIQNAQGQRRLDLPEDWIRQEIATALRRNVRVVPVLIEGTPLPDASDLPEDLKPLVRRQSMDLADARWRGDLQRLIETLERVPGLHLKPSSADKAEKPEPAPMPPKSGRKQLWVGMGLGVFGLIVLSLLVEGNKATEDTQAQAGAATQQQEPGVARPVVQQVSPQLAQTLQQEEAAKTAPALPNLAGMWRSLSGEIYQLQQSGRQIQLSAEVNGQPFGGGRGELDGTLLRIAMTFQVAGQAPISANCNMQLAADHASMVGQCLGPNGPFAAQMFR
ncbi:toll/interleukin-1 receptor domain-containing protein [Paucibacter sp. Y2R2-4]|uniref:toll/interleukin-1 receptor domain-containing protein n=1 Tax=Paucibacter sp. Y2R2-4 TaxID=2893553 RepID=UPI0021E4A512|nr:toll/interleukin-1 receptor domain-containing protein [Paucibacter sp. Y2R2-4]MCV2349627.1 toll/interleukin-1 receptor domain-containing protein [Paucibacter sp. Y2R2-4]